MKEDIYGGMKNALERGESMESAIQSFIRAGYKESEVREVAKSLSGVMSITVPQINIQTPTLQKNIHQENIPQPQRNYTQIPAQQMFLKRKPEPRNSSGKIIVLLSILLILIAALVTTIIFKEPIIEYITGFF